MAIMTAVVGARERYLSRGFDSNKARIYLSDQCHGCINKAVHFAGLHPSSIIVIPTVDHRLKTSDLHSVIQKDVDQGYKPLLIVGAAGTTNTGTIEPLDELADIAAQYDAWYHVDACYGGFFILTDRIRMAMKGINRADSISLDPHKSLFTPSGTGVLLVREAKTFANALSPNNRGPYLRDCQPVDANSWPDFADIGPELTRERRGLKLWLPLHRHGVEAYRRLLDERLDLANHLYDALAEIPELEMLGRPDMSIVCARLKGHPSRTDRFLIRLTASERFHYSSTILDGRSALRFCILQWRTKQVHVELAIQAVKEELWYFERDESLHESLDRVLPKS